VSQSQVVEGDDFSIFLAANDNKQLFFYPNGYRYAGEIAPMFEGEMASAVSVKKYKPNSATKIEGISSEFEIPVSSFEENKSIVKSKITFSGQNPLELKIKRTTVCTGDTIDGLVKKAGDNLLFDAGKLIGTQWIPTEKERKRDWDAYLSAPMSIENEIIIEIPAHYTIYGIENLNKKIDNKYGSFTSSATVDGNELRILIVKVYKQNFVPENDWNILLDMIDTTNDFYSQPIILKHNNLA
jgi:hypothetical protein